MLAQVAPATKDERLLDLATDCHPETLRQIHWTDTMLKELSPQLLSSTWTVRAVMMTAMHVTTVAATLIGTTVGALASFSSTLLIQRATLTRERENRIWERRATVYEDALTSVNRGARFRAGVMETGELPEAPAQQGREVEADLVLARLKIYGSRPVVNAQATTIAAMTEWITGFAAWKEQAAHGGTPVRDPAQDPLWADVLQAAERAQGADREFVDVIQAEIQTKMQVDGAARPLRSRLVRRRPS
jgi:hypothetical protein